MKRSGKGLTTLGTGIGLIVEEERGPIEVVGEDARLEPKLAEAFIEPMLNTFRMNLKYVGTEPEWVDLRVSLKRYFVKMGPTFVNFNEIFQCMEEMSDRGYKGHLMEFLELASQMPTDAGNMLIFVEGLLKFGTDNPVKTPATILQSMLAIEPDNWHEAILYLDLIEEEDLFTAELASRAIANLEDEPRSFRTLVLQIARIADPDVLDEFVLLLKYLRRTKKNAEVEIHPALDMIAAGDNYGASMFLYSLSVLYRLRSGTKHSA